MRRPLPTKAVEIQPDNPDVWYHRSLALVELQQYEDAIISLIKPLNSSPMTLVSGITEALL